MLKEPALQRLGLQESFKSEQLNSGRQENLMIKQKNQNSQDSRLNFNSVLLKSNYEVHSLVARILSSMILSLLQTPLKCFPPDPPVLVSLTATPCCSSCEAL